MRTIALHVTRLAAGASFSVPPTTSSRIMAVMAGRGKLTAGAETFAWGRGDALALPAGGNWAAIAETEAYLLSATDEPVLAALGWLRPLP